ncbi:putative FAD binding domain protein [Neofusicoccum parvum]|nr:putative FAD binding domain protein [Neofusicoccum parvum]
MEKKDFKVVIAGGSIAGLTLACILEKLGIDFVVLEAYPEIAPQVGASIGLLPNGLRILDQLGLYPAIRGLIQEPLTRSISRGADGKAFLNVGKMDEHFRNRHGYDVIFIDRQMVLQALYDHLKSKDKVLTNKRVVKVSHQDSGVSVTTKDGTVYQGDILVGADGIHSAVRTEMWKIAEQIKPGYIPASEHTALPCDYVCMFGISVMKNFVRRSTNHIFNKHTSMLVITGPNARVYWFFFVKLDKTHYGPDIPRYTKREEEEFATKHASENVTEDVTFGDLYKTRISSVLTALPEYAFKKWHFGRIITIGDAAHKFEPTSGQGGNSAIETAAVLANNLTRMMKSHPEGLSDDHIDTAFSETQKLRQPRAWELIKASHLQQAIEAMETPILELMVKYYMPIMSVDQRLAAWTKSIESAHRLEMLDVPKRFRFIPFVDELPSKPLQSSVMPRLVTGVAFGSIFWVAQQVLQINPDGWTSKFVDHPLKKTYTGIPAIDSTLSLLVWCFSTGVAGNDPNFRLQCLYFMIMLIPMALIWTIESYRPVVFGAVYQVFGIGKVAPIYYLISIYTSSNILYTRTTGRPIHSSVAHALLPALCIGYILPTALMFLPYTDPSIHQTMVALWQPFPIYVAALTWGIASIIRHTNPTQPLHLEMFEQKDLTPLQASYSFAFGVTALTHLASLFYIFASSSLSIAEVFFNLPGPATPASAAAKSVFAFFKWDMVLCFAAALVYCLYSVFELRRVGYITTEQAARAAVLTVAAQSVVGPGAAYAGVWAWREGVVAAQVRTGK